MKVLFISRKKSNDIGGLARFYAQLSSRFPKSILKPDLIHLCDATLLPLGVILKLILQKSLTLTVHGLDITYPNRLYQTMLRILIPQADAIIADSQATKKLLTPFHLKNKVVVIPPGISIDHLNPPSSRSSPAKGGTKADNLKNKLILLTVGNLVPRKGHAWFINNVFPRLSKQFVYIVVGDGPQKPAILLNQRIILTGRINNSQLGSLYKLADIYVCPNQHIEGDFEGFGIAAGEAARLGLPVVASNVDGIPEIIKDGKNGMLVEPNPPTFIKIINRLKDFTLRKKLGQKAKLYTENHHNWKKTISGYTKVFQQVGKT